MSDNCMCCVPARFMNAAGEAVSGIWWIDQKLLGLKKVGIIVSVEDEPAKAKEEPSSNGTSKSRKADHEDEKAREKVIEAKVVGDKGDRSQTEEMAPNTVLQDQGNDTKSSRENEDTSPKLRLMQYDIVKVAPTWIDAHLVNDIHIRPHDTRAKTLIGRIHQFWKSTEKQRHSRPFVSTYVGICLVLALYFSVRWLLDSVGFLDHPFPAMVWLWAYFGSNLDDIVMVFTLFFFVILLARQLYVVAGIVLTTGLLLATAAADIAAILTEELSPDERWPEAYIFFWSEYKTIFAKGLHPWLSWLSEYWPAVTIALNAIGLATFAEAVNQIIGLVTKPKPDQGTAVDANLTGSLQQQTQSTKMILANSNSQGATVLSDILYAMELGLRHPVIPADLKPKGPIPLSVPPKPPHCYAS